VSGLRVGVVTFPGSLDDVDAARALTLAGHGNVAVYDGSLQEWAADPALPMDTSA